MVEFPEGFDLAALLRPISGDAPQGTDIREDFSSQSLYRRLRDIRSDARVAERERDNRIGWTKDDDDLASAPIPDPMPIWAELGAVGLKSLAETTKDLEVAAWVTEALVRCHGLPGLTAGATKG